MADNVPITAGSGTDVATDQVTGTGEHVQLFKLAVSADGSRSLVTADSNGLLVNVSQLPTIPAGSNTIGFVGITDGSNSLVVDTAHNDGESTTENHIDTASKLMGFNGTSWDRLRSSTTNGLQVDVTRITGSIPAGSNLIGTVGISDGTNPVVVDTSASDGESASTAALVVNSRLKAYNGTGWDRVRGTVNTNKTAQYTAAQTGVALWTPAAGRAVVITSLQIQVGGTTAGNVQVWFGGSADTTYTRGTDFPIFDGEFAPSNTNKPGVYVTFPTPVRGTADFVLRVTTSAAINPITISVWGYEV